MHSVSAEDQAQVRPARPEMRRMLAAASALVLVAGLQLFVFSEQTERYFAWTVNPPLTAAFLGAGFWSSFVLELLAARERQWARARVAVPAVLVFTTLTLVATLLHLDRFHLDTPFGRAWVAVYVIVPPLLLFFLLRQLRAPGGDPRPGEPLPAWIRAAVGFEAGLLLVLGAALFLAPAAIAPLWPWMLTPLTARAVAAWLLGLGIAAAQVTHENDRQRARIAFAAYAAFGALELIALARYPGTLNWADPRAWIYLLFLASALAIGLAGWRAGRRG